MPFKIPSKEELYKGIESLNEDYGSACQEKMKSASVVKGIFTSHDDSRLKDIKFIQSLHINIQKHYSIYGTKIDTTFKGQDKNPFFNSVLVGAYLFVLNNIKQTYGREWFSEHTNSILAKTIYSRFDVDFDKDEHISNEQQFEHLIHLKEYIANIENYYGVKSVWHEELNDGLMGKLDKQIKKMAPEESKTLAIGQ
jgi:hypothetical protein